MRIANEAGADTAKLLLMSYVPGKGFATPKIGPFWDAVAIAHDAGRFGRGCRIAVVEAGLDTGLVDPALLAWPVPPPEDGEDDPTRLERDRTHGAAVTLLIQEVAPEATLTIYPTANRRDYIEKALQAAQEAQADVVNLSFGIPRKSEEVYDKDAFFSPDVGNAGGDPIRFFFEQAAHMGTRSSWRDFVTPMTGWLDLACNAVAQAGATVITSVGNSEAMLGSPACAEHVLSVGYKTVTREMGEEGFETATAQGPSFSQSLLTDLTLTQLPNALGSSFAAPLISGFAALMEDRTTLPAYARVAHYAGLASMLFAMRQNLPPQWDDARDGVILDLYLKAIKAMPHDYFSQPASALKPDAAAACFVTSPMINFGLFHQQFGNLEPSYHLLNHAHRLAPHDPDGAANLAVTKAFLAQNAVAQGALEDAAQFLQEAADHMDSALEKRSYNVHYKARAEEFRTASRDPANWTMQT